MDRFQRLNLILKMKPPLDPDFLPASLWNLAFRQQVAASHSKVVRIALEREGGNLSSYELAIVDSSDSEVNKTNLFYVERTIKKFTLDERGVASLFERTSRDCPASLENLFPGRGKSL